MCVCATVCGCVQKEPARSNDLKRGQLLAAQLRWFTNSIAAGERGRYRDEVQRFRDSGRKVWRRREKSNNGGKKTSFRRNSGFKKAHVRYVYYGIVVQSVSAVYIYVPQSDHTLLCCVNMRFMFVCFLIISEALCCNAEHTRTNSWPRACKNEHWNRQLV